MKLKIDELKRIAEAATPGPWTVRKDEVTGQYRCVLDADGLGIAIDLCNDEAKHIAAFNPQVALALIARITELEGAIKHQHKVWAHEPNFCSPECTQLCDYLEGDA